MWMTAGQMADLLHSAAGATAVAVAAVDEDVAAVDVVAAVDIGVAAVHHSSAAAAAA